MQSGIHFFSLYRPMYAYVWSIHMVTASVGQDYSHAVLLDRVEAQPVHLIYFSY